MTEKLGDDDFCVQYVLHRWCSSTGGSRRAERKGSGHGVYGFFIDSELHSGQRGRVQRSASAMNEAHSDSEVRSDVLNQCLHVPVIAPPDAVFLSERGHFDLLDDLDRIAFAIVHRYP